MRSTGAGRELKNYVTSYKDWPMTTVVTALKRQSVTGTGLAVASRVYNALLRDNVLIWPFIPVIRSRLPRRFTGPIMVEFNFNCATARRRPQLRQVVARRVRSIAAHRCGAYTLLDEPDAIPVSLIAHWMLVFINTYDT